MAMNDSYDSLRCLDCFNFKMNLDHKLTIYKVLNKIIRKLKTNMFEMYKCLKQFVLDHRIDRALVKLKF